MMLALWFFVFALSRGLNSVYVKKAQSSRKNGFYNAVYFIFMYALLQAIFLFAIPPYKNIPMTMDFLIYPVCFGICYIISYSLLFFALAEGPTGLTNVIYTFHSILPMITGIILWKDTLDFIKAVGVVFAAITIYLFYLSVKNGDKRKKSLRWILFIVSATVFMGIAVVFTQAFSHTFTGMDKQYLVVYTVSSSLISLVLLMFIKPRKSKEKTEDRKKNEAKDLTEKHTVRYYVFVLVAAVTQNAVNLFFMYFLTVMPSTILFPTLNSINILTFVLVGRLFFGEKLNKLSFIGICCSIVSLVLLYI
jgi:drug/metabolite transporter (DMT)-like permease